MKRKKFWITLTLFNLCIVAFLGLTLRTKFLFPIPFLDYKNLLSAHSHFAFGGWVTLAIMILFIDNLLAPDQQQKRTYQFILWGIELSSFGMLFTFPFTGYALFSIFFSTSFIFITYYFTWEFIKDIKKNSVGRSVRWLSISSLISLSISSIGPFTLAYMMATDTGNAIRFRDCVYTYLHFQYNGFFTLAVFALFFHNKLKLVADKAINIKMDRFSAFLILSIIPGLFLSLLWHNYNPYIRGSAILGCGLIIITIFLFARLAISMKKLNLTDSPIIRTLLALFMISFIIKMTLQTGTIIPSLGNVVFGYRPIIIGFLHLVFLGMVTFYILSNFIEAGVFQNGKKHSLFAIRYFIFAIILNEGILLVNGIGLMFHTTSQVYGWLLWIAAMGLFSGSILLLTQRSRHS